MSVFYKKNRDKISELEIILDKEKVKKTVDQEFKKISSQISMKGFRKGKVPINLVESIAENETYKKVTKELAMEEIQKYLSENKINCFTIPNLGKYEEKDDGYLIKASIDDYDLVDISFEGIENIEKPIVESPTEDDILKILRNLAFHSNLLISGEKLEPLSSQIIGEAYIKIDEKEIKIKDEYIYNISDEKKIKSNSEEVKINDTVSIEITDDLKESLQNILEKNENKTTETVFLKIKEIKKVDIDNMNIKDWSKAFGIDINDLEDSKKNIYELIRIHIDKILKKSVYDYLNREVINLFLKQHKEINISEDRLTFFIEVENSNDYFKVQNIETSEVVKDKNIRAMYKVAMQTSVILESFKEKMNLKVDDLFIKDAEGFILPNLQEVYMRATNTLNFKGTLQGFVSLDENKYFISNLFRRNALAYALFKYVKESINFKEKKMSFSEFENLKNISNN